MQFKKFFLPLILILAAAPCISFGSQTPQTDMQEIVSWMYDNGLTVFSSSDTFGTERNIRRDEVAKLVTIFSEDILYQEGQENPICYQFNDIDNIINMKDYVIQSCELGYMKGNNNKFYPAGNLTNEQAIAIIMRMAEGRLDEPTGNRSKNYYSRAAELELLDGLNLSERTKPITRGNFAILLYRVNNNMPVVAYGDNDIFGELAEGLSYMFESVFSILGMKINSYSGINNDFIAAARSCQSGARATTEVSFDMMGMTLYMKSYRQIRGLEGAQCKMYERIDAASVDISTGQTQGTTLSSSNQAELDERLAQIKEALPQIQSAIQETIGKDGICRYDIGTLVESLQSELSGELTSILDTSSSNANCTGALYDSDAMGVIEI